MKQYIILILLVIISIAQVSWGGFLAIRGFTIPIALIFLWLIRMKYDFSKTIGFGFMSGLVIDLLSSTPLGMHTFAILVSLGGVELISNRFEHRNRFIYLMSFVLSVVIYTLAINWMGQLF